MIVLEVNILIFHTSAQSLDEDIVKHAPRPSMLMVTWAISNRVVKAREVNCAPGQC